MNSVRGPAIEEKFEKKDLREYFKQYLLFSILCSDCPHRNSLPSKMVVSTSLAGRDNALCDGGAVCNIVTHNPLT